MPEGYSPVASDEEKLLPVRPSDVDSTEASPRAFPLRSRSTYSPCVTGFHWVLHSITIILLVLLVSRHDFCNVSFAPSGKPTNGIGEYSPAYADIPSSRNSYYHVFNAAFWAKSPYKGPPTPEILERWDRLTDTPPLNLTAAEMTKLGLSLDSAQYPKSAGGGYMGFLESAHQLHCLHALWARHHFNKYPEMFPMLAAKIEEDPYIEEWHFEHCMDVIRQRLMCTADPSIVTFRWVKNVSGPYPNFQTGHMCRNYEQLLEWNEGRKADVSKLEGWDWHVNLTAGDVQLSHVP